MISFDFVLNNASSTNEDVLDSISQCQEIPDLSFEPTLQEILKAIKQISAGKAPKKMPFHKKCSNTDDQHRLGKHYLCLLRFADKEWFHKTSRTHPVTICSKITSGEILFCL